MQDLQPTNEPLPWRIIHIALKKLPSRRADEFHLLEEN
ncbi:hypothetical protein VARIO8X_150009 [Burkholderiales bacterium 8X]|nr:hypothetical protein VARIO8X_150009 [Burkholderiales bacterium 8X]